MSVQPVKTKAKSTQTTHADMRPLSGSAYYFSCLYAIWSREVKRSVRESGQLVGAFSRPLLWVIIFGVGLTPYFRTGLRETT